MILLLSFVAVAAVVYAIHKHATVAQVKSEIAAFEKSATADAKSVIAKIKSIL